ncbi:lipoma-preferred partner homolog isoform X2 [Dicentrarchus labrax]|uniref:lipoma-preferred partner homolog isoform X2 n=1 Tax=Dicentrarchus labrax TaxID=13489 RepID=UPI0021F504A7|nr:lipoma-preferred partner homolog isoform X2 [Dicentrarchus labrax]
MALGLLLQVTSISFLLFDGGVGVPAIKGYGYPYKSDSSNMVEEEVMTWPTFDQSNWQSSNNPPAGSVYTTNKKPEFTQSAWAPSRQNLPNTPSSREVERLTDGLSRPWGLETADKPLLFPLKLTDPAKPQPGPVQPQSAPLGVASTYSMPSSPSAGGPTSYYAPSSTSPAAQSPSFASWQPEPDSSGYGMIGYNAGSSADSGANVPHLVYEEVFQYPSSNTEPSSNGAISNAAGGSSIKYNSPLLPSYPPNIVAQPAYPSGMRGFPGGVRPNIGQTGKPRDEISSLPQKTVIRTQKVVSQRLTEPVPPSRYIIQSRNGYQQHQHHLSKSSYSPEFPPLMPVRSKAVKGPAPSQPAAPQGVSYPQRTK